MDRSRYPSAQGVQRGGYVLWESKGDHPDVILIGTGSETHMALDAGRQLAAEGIETRMVSMPSWELFDRQQSEYRESVLPLTVRARVAVEAGVKLGWERYVGLDGAAVGMDGFGTSAPAPVLYEKFGITTKDVVAVAKAKLKK